MNDLLNVPYVCLLSIVVYQPSVPILQCWLGILMGKKNKKNKMILTIKKIKNIWPHPDYLKSLNYGKEINNIHSKK